MAYRADIDGLRAVAVLPVILYHAGFEVLGGGYAGVDIFFVISGFLITSILLREMQQGSFSLSRFYVRRARRILPALGVVLASTTIAAVILMPTQSLIEYGRTLSGVALFFSNHVFFMQSDYFSPAAETTPLLHTWSLAVEEQFYFVLPLILLLVLRIWRDRTGLGAEQAIGIALAALALASLGATLALTQANPMGAFYLLPFRAWELLAGSLCAWVMWRAPLRPSSWLSGLGLALIVGSLVALDAQSLDRAAYLLFPVLGACLVVLFSGPGTLVNAILSQPVLVGIGLVSYSAYLWHQPVFAFARIASLDEPAPVTMLALSVLTLILAWLTWRFVEGPMRRGSWGGRVLLRSGLASAGVACAGFVLVLSDGLAFRLSPELRAIEAAALDVNPLRSTCHVMHTEPLPQHPVRGCGTPNALGNFDVILLGDSHADAIGGALSEALSAEGLSVYTVTHSDCTGLPGLRQLDKADINRCDRYARELLAFAEARGVHTVIYMSRLTVHDSAEGFDNGEGGVERLRKGCQGSAPVEMTPAPACADPDRQLAFRARAVQELNEVASRFRLVLVYPVPEVGWHVPLRAFKLARIGHTAEISTRFSAFLDRHERVFDLLDAVKGPDVRRVYPHEVFCYAGQSGRCVAATAERVYYYDDDHLSHTGAAPVVEAIVARTVGLEPAVTPGDQPQR